jgi:hypothetical protein
MLLKKNIKYLCYDNYGKRKKGSLEGDFEGDFEERVYFLFLI